jgi:hypothetical protein
VPPLPYYDARADLGVASPVYGSDDGAFPFADHAHICPWHFLKELSGFICGAVTAKYNTCVRGFPANPTHNALKDGQERGYAGNGNSICSSKA